MSVALPERSRPPHKVLLVMPDLQIFIISPPDNLIMQRTRIHFAPRRKPARAALSSDYFPALAAALYKPTRTPSIMLLSPRLLGPPSAGSEAALLLLSGLECAHKDPKRGWRGGGGGQEHLAHMPALSLPRWASVSQHRTFLFPSAFCLCVLKTSFQKFPSSLVCVTVTHHLS